MNGFDADCTGNEGVVSSELAENGGVGSVVAFPVFDESVLLRIRSTNAEENIVRGGNGEFALCHDCGVQNVGI